MRWVLLLICVAPAVLCAQSPVQISSAPGGIVLLDGGMVHNGAFYSAAILSGDHQIWRTDGTGAGTQAAGVLFPSPDIISQGFSALGTYFYFRRDSGLGTWELRRTNGTVAGDTVVWAGLAGVGASAVLNGKLYFWEPAGTPQLYSTDGTAGGTAPVLSGGATPPGFLLGCVAVGGSLLLSYNGSAGHEWYISDGTAAGTSLLLDINPSGDSSPDLVHSSGGKVYFWADNGTAGREPWVSDGTAGGTLLLADIDPGAGGSDYFPGSPWTTRNGVTLFRMTFPEDSIWRTDGTVAGTFKLLTSVPATTLYASHDVFVGGYWYLSVISLTAAGQLWRSDGTVAGTTIVRTFSNGVSPDFLVEAGGQVVFRTVDMGTGATHLWQSDGSSAGTTQPPGYDPTGKSILSVPGVVNNQVLLNIQTAAPGAQLWSHLAATAPPPPPPGPGVSPRSSGGGSCAAGGSGLSWLALVLAVVPLAQGARAGRRQRVR